MKNEVDWTPAMGDPLRTIFFRMRDAERRGLPMPNYREEARQWREHKTAPHAPQLRLIVNPRFKD